MTSSNQANSNRLLETIKAFVHFGAFIVTGLFTCLIIVTVRHNQELHQNLRYVLLCQHCICVTGFTLWAQLYTLSQPYVGQSLESPVGSSLTAGGDGTRFDDHPHTDVHQHLSVHLHATSLPHSGPALVRWVTLVACILALLNPVVFTVLACVRFPWDYVVGLDTKCSTALEGTACIASALALLLLLVLLIIISYMAIYLEGRRAGHFTRSNSKGRHTILIHSLQMSLHILPSVIIISRHQEALPVAVSIFILFSFAQSLSPVVFGLRCKELYKDMPQFLPCFWGNCGSCGHIGSMESTSTGTAASIETTASTCMATSTPSAITTEHESETEGSDFAELTV